MIKYFRKNRLSRSMYKYKCSRTELSNQALSDAEKLADEAISSELRRDNSMDLDSVSDARDVVDPLGSPCAPMEGVTPTQPCTSAAAVAEALRAQAAAEQAAEQAAKQAAEQAAQAAEQAAEQPAQPAAPTGTSAGTSGPPAVAKRPFYSRAFGNLAPSLVQASIFYQPSVLVQLSNGRAAPATDAAEPTVCARPNINFAKHEGSNGVTWIDTAWMCQGGGDGAPKFEGWRKLALHVLNQSKSRTVKQFDYHLDGLRDVLYLISSEDNRRRLQERPHMPSDRLLGHWLEDVENSRITESTRAVRTRPFAHPELAAALAPPGFMGPKRLPDAFVASSNLQRRFDAQLLAGRFSVMQTLLSNRILVSPPVRLVNDQVHFSTSAAHDHLHLVAEAAVACSKIPGLKNMQETFCHDQKGPPGLSVRRSNANDGDVTSQQSEDSRAPSRTGSEAGNGPVSRGARGKDDIFDSAAKHHTLPYSYDLVQIFLSLQMADMLYDDISESHLERANKQYGSALDVKLTTEDIPQLTLRYPGYSERNRQTISIPLRRKRARMYSFVEAADPTTGEAHISIDHVTRSISRPATHDDLVQYVSRRQGSRSMKGVSGDLFASSTWLHHTIATLSDRGLVGSGTDLDSSKLLFANMLTCLTSRAIELASAKGLAGYGALKIAPSQPRTYAALAKRELLAAEQRAVRDADGLFGAPGMQMRTSINDCMLDATEIAYPALPGLAPPSPAPSASRIPRPVDAGSSGAGPSGYGGTSVIDGDEELHMSRPVDMTAEILSQPHL
jgi:hypothetical protein